MAHHCSCHSCGHSHHTHEASAPHKSFLHRVFAYADTWVPALMLASGIALTHFGIFPDGTDWRRLVWYVVAFLPVGLPVIMEALEEIRKGDVFNEFTLMVIATVGAFCIGEYPEAVAVMLFYAVGERFQDSAVDKAQGDIQALIALRPETVAVVRDGERVELLPESVQPGEIIELNAGDRVPLDGILLGDEAVAFDTSALTGESVPRTIEAGGEVAAGMLTGSRAVRLKVVRAYADSALSRILEMVKDAASRKAPVELFIRRFARIYTPTVIALAALIAVVPPLAAPLVGWTDVAWSDYIYRALVFLVVSCPCALVVSVPLSYFSGIGYASRRGILFKGGNYLDALARVDTVVFDKTGTLTQGQFGVDDVQTAGALTREALLALAAAAERHSSHPLARAIVTHAEETRIVTPKTGRVEELAGRGLRAEVDGHEVLAGNRRFLADAGIALPADAGDDALNEVVCAVDGEYAGRIVLRDLPRPESADAVREIAALGVRRQTMLSGDRTAVVADLAARIGLKDCHGDLLPEQKVAHVKTLLDDPTCKCLAFVGDGINDAPALALSHVGIAMGGVGSDAAVETADVVIQGDSPAKVPEAIRIARATRRLVHTNIALAIGIKLVVLLLGALGMAPLWVAVLADTGVALLCVANVFTLPWLIGKKR
ncbi:MAG: heavy metal translocating P-type ATPase [Bacteroidales bacterium]|nr:heavy metal translocating P-type ATPase [Bacteroidales bacterium]